MQDLPDPPKAIDWDYIHGLYMQGVGPSEIARKTGVKADTISVRATRHGWTSTLRRTGGPRQDVTIEVQGDAEGNPESGRLTKASAKARQSLSDEVLRAVATLTDTKPSKSLGTQSKRVQVLQTLAGAAKTVFGWSEGQSQPSVRISVMANAVTIEEQGKVIDVTSTSVLLPQDSESSASDTKPQ